MRDLNWYLNTARLRAGLPSDAALAPLLGVTDGAISQWRTKRAWPRGKPMVMLAKLCGVDPTAALADLGSWREPEVSEWKELIQKLGAVATGSVLIAALLVPGFSPHPAEARELQTGAAVYYGAWRRFLNRLVPAHA